MKKSKKSVGKLSQLKRIFSPVFVFFLFSLVVLILFLGKRAFDATKNSPLPPPAKKNFEASVEKKKWQNYMYHVGVEKAYGEFKNAYDDLPLSTAHSSMHYIGELIYELEGAKGIAICDDVYSYGCFHGYFGAAIQDKGLTELPQMDQACIQRLGKGGTGCQHGIGHGIMAYVGEKKLVEALEACDTLQWPSSLGGCKSGVFMEYNFHTISHTKPAVTRPLNSSPFAPCNHLPEKFQAACYYSQPQWWNSVYNNDYSKIGDLCTELEGPKRNVCFLAMGSMAGQSSNYNSTNTIKKCDTMSLSYENMLCKAGATWIFNATKQQKEKTDMLCKSLPEDLVLTCMEKSEVVQ